jgi:hypothetical protein
MDSMVREEEIKMEEEKLPVKHIIGISGIGWFLGWMFILFVLGSFIKSTFILTRVNWYINFGFASFAFAIARFAWNRNFKGAVSIFSVLGYIAWLINIFIYINLLDNIAHESGLK